MSAPDFRLYHGNDLDVLAGLLAAELARPHADAALLATDTILIPQPAMRRWLQKTLAESHGIAANLRFLTPGEFVRAALDANVKGEGDAAVADAAALRWRLWSLLADEAAMRAPVFAPLQAVLAGDDRALAAWHLAGELAAAFEKYQAWRRDWLRRWDHGGDRDDWQAELWRRATRGQSHRGQRLDDYLRHHHGEHAQAPQGLPSRLFVFACQNVSPDVLRVIASAAQNGPLHCYVLSPVEGWWGDLQTRRERLRNAPEQFFDGDENPLLRANGAAGRDFIRLLFGDDAVQPSFEQALYVPPDPNSRTGLLHRLQRDLLARRPPPDESEDRPILDPSDRSLQVHACHTRLREVQVLHEQLRALLERDPSLQPRDIAVLTPDIDSYAPQIRAVFGDGAGAQVLPYSLADQRADDAPVVEAFLHLLALPGARFASNDVLELLALPAIAARFGLDAGELSRLTPWLQAAGARWGLDARHREQLGAPAESAYTWAFALDRLLLGYSTGEDQDVQGVAPLPGLDGDALLAFDGLLAALRMLARWQARWSRPQPAHAWPLQWAQLLDEAFAPRPGASEDRRALEFLRTQIERFARQVEAAELEGELSLSVVRAWWQDALSESDLRQPLLTGGVTFARMVPMRLIPFRVICLLGMNDGEYPRRDPAGGLNRLAGQLGGSQRRRGDRSLREDDRLLFLQLFAAASDVFYLSYLGRDPRSDDPRPPSVVVAELVELAARYLRPDGVLAATPEELPKTLIVRHPLQPFSPEAFGRGDARRLSYHAGWRAAAASDAERRLPPVFVAGALDPAATALPRLSLEELRRTLLHPPRAFLRQRLDLQLPREQERLPEQEPFDRGDGLQRHALIEQVFAALIAQPDLDAETLRRRLLARALIAPGAAGAAELADARAQLQAAIDTWRGWAQGAAGTRAFELDLGETVLTGSLGPVHAGGLLQFRAGKAHGRNRLALDLDWLLWSALGETRPVFRLFGDGAESARVIAPLSPVAAKDALRELLRLQRRALAEPLPFMPKAGYAYARAVSDDQPGTEEKAWAFAQAEWRPREGHGEGDEADVRLALRGDDPFENPQGASARRFRELARQVFAATAQRHD